MHNTYDELEKRLNKLATDIRVNYAAFERDNNHPGEEREQRLLAKFRAELATMFQREYDRGGADAFGRFGVALRDAPLTLAQHAAVIERAALLTPEANETK